MREAGSDLSPFELLKYGKVKERRIRATFCRLIKLVKNQRVLSEDGDDLTSKYVRPYERRNMFKLLELPKNLPFELFAYFRCHKLQSLTETNDENETRMHELHYMHENMFRFDEELVISSTQVDEWSLDYCLFQPIMANACR